jgi:hypothetical protein
MYAHRPTQLHSLAAIYGYRLYVMDQREICLPSFHRLHTHRNTSNAIPPLHLVACRHTDPMPKPSRKLSRCASSAGRRWRTSCTSFDNDLRRLQAHAEDQFHPVGYRQGLRGPAVEAG